MTENNSTPKKRGRPKKAVSEATTSSPATVLKDPLDNKLDHFQYHASDRDLDIWEHTDISPVHVPKDIKEKYPGLRFRYVSKQRWDKYGKEYHGWQRFTDPALAPDGVNRGNDTFLAAMPEERALAYNRYVSQKSREAVQGIQDTQIENAARMERAGIEPLGTGLVVETNQPRTGYNRQQLLERIRKNREEHAKKKVYFT